MMVKRIVPKRPAPVLFTGPEPLYHDYLYSQLVNRIRATIRMFVEHNPMLTADDVNRALDAARQQWERP
jgi:hypothetical protein